MKLCSLSILVLGVVSPLVLWFPFLCGVGGVSTFVDGRFLVGVFGRFWVVFC